MQLLSGVPLVFEFCPFFGVRVWLISKGVREGGQKSIKGGLSAGVVAQVRKCQEKGQKTPKSPQMFKRPQRGPTMDQQLECTMFVFYASTAQYRLLRAANEHLGSLTPL